ncbi:MAG: SDR family oxidoreductase [Kiritimatiellaeota bacterium]|nr:SDR family oxidoreductase [Kiritimatiellota bacterium]
MQTDKLLDGKAALVTGAGRGIGRAVATLLAANGACVGVTARTAAQVELVAREITAAGGRAEAFAGDLTSDAFRNTLFGEFHARFGRMDILVNNAGVAPFGSVQELSVGAFRDCLELNVIAVFSCMQRAIRLMEEQDEGGKIVNVGSVRSHWTEHGDAGAYNASKFALRALTETVARQLHGTGSRVAVSLVCPGVVDTSMTNPRGEPRPGWLRPEAVARAVLHAVTAPADVNVFDTTLFPLSQKPW